MSDKLDIDRLRRDTPASRDLIHFNNAGASLIPNPVSDSVFQHLDLERRIGGYEAEAAAQVEIEDFYDAFAELLHCGRDEVAYAESATRAWDMAVYSLPLRAGDRILTHESEYASNWIALTQLSQRLGVVIDAAPSDSSGQVDIDAMRRMITPETRVIALTHVPTHNGLVNPAAEAGALAREYGLIFVLDACQSAGQLPLDVRALGCHVLSGTGRKFLRGPRGTGFLFVERGLLAMLEPAFVDMRAATARPPGGYDLRADARRFEAWESSIAGRVGLRAAVRYLLELGVDAVSARILLLASSLRNTLASLPGIVVHDRGVLKSGIVTFTVDGESGEATAKRLRERRANVSVAAPVGAPLDTQIRALGSAVRASVHCYNTDEEIARFAALVTDH
jgi:selenocysteine lyase/cysteine desulfurase